MSNLIAVPGSFVYTAGRGLGILLGKKTMIIESLGDSRHSFWDIRGLRNLQSPHAIPVEKINNGSIRSLANKETLIAAFDRIINPTPLGNISHSSRVSTFTKGVASANPSDVAQVIGALTKRYRDGKSTILSVSKQDRDIVEQAADLLADDLAMASGLSFAAAVEHIYHLAFSAKPANLWPLQARDAKPSMLDEETFKTAFGIDFDQAEDLDTYHPVIEPKDIVTPDGRSRDKSTQSILSFLERGAATVMSPKLQKNLGRNLHMQPLFQEIAALSPSHGIAKTALEFAFMHLGPKQIQALAYTDLVRADERLSPSDLAVKLAISEDDAETLIVQSRQHYIDAAEKKNKRIFADLIGKTKMDRVEQDIKVKPYQYSTKDQETKCSEENKDTYALYTASVSDRGPGRGSFELAAATMDAHSFAVITPLYFIARDKRPTMEELAKKMNVSNTQIEQDVKKAIKEFADQAVAIERRTYISLDMAAVNPDVAELRVARQWKKKSNEAVLLEEGSSPSGASKPQTFTSPKSIDEEDELSPEIEAITEEQPASENNTQPHEEPEIEIIDRNTPDIDLKQNVPDEDDVLDHIRNNGFDSKSLENLGVIYEAKNEWQHALYLYGAALDLNEDGDLWLGQRVERMEEKLGYQYSTEKHFSFIETFIQERLDNVPLEDNIINAEFVEVSSEESPATSEPQQNYIFEQPHPADQSNRQTTPAQVLPRISYGIPAEALVPGQRLKMVFTQSHNGSMEVTMEVEIVKAEGGKSHIRSNGLDANDGLDVAFEATANGQTYVSINGQHYSPEQPQQHKAKP